jgi:hypothetical protein
MVKVLIDSGADKEKGPGGRFTPLYMACTALHYTWHVGMETWRW